MPESFNHPSQNKVKTTRHLSHMDTIRSCQIVQSENLCTVRGTVNGKWPALTEHFPGPSWNQPALYNGLSFSLAHLYTNGWQLPSNTLLGSQEAILGSMSCPQTLQTCELFDRADISTTNPSITNSQPTLATAPQPCWRSE